MKTLLLFKQLSSLIRQPELTVRVDHEILETDYLEPTADDLVLVHDRTHAHSYLSTKNDRTYRDWDERGVEQIRQPCDRLELTLEILRGDDSDPGFNEHVTCPRPDAH